MLFRSLGKSGICHNIAKQPSLIEPEDFRSIEDAELIYRGDLKKYRSYIAELRADANMSENKTIPLYSNETA